MPQRRCLDCKQLYDRDATGTWRCPRCQPAATAARQRRPSSSKRGYNGRYQRNKPKVIALGRAGHPCVICGKPFQPGEIITVEHIKPLRNGGTNDLSNLGPAHSGCNTGWNRKR